MKYSIRMRSAQGGAHEVGGTHISGAERLVDKEDIEKLAGELIKRALNHSKGEADFIRITIDAIKDDDIITIPLLKIDSSNVATYEEGRQRAAELLVTYGVSPQAAQAAINTLHQLKTNYRGALLLDAQTGQRLDSFADRGVRVSRMDYASDKNSLETKAPNSCNNIHFQEAIVLASKVLSTPGIIAELCWSDDPDYITGYVSGNGTYHRISKMKPLHSPLGGRVFFVDTKKASIEDIIHYLQKQVVLVK